MKFFTMKFFALAVICLIGVMGCAETSSPTSANGTPNAGGRDTSKDRDNTETNVRDRDTSTKTPIDQNENQRDIDITAEIRKRIVDTKMSVNAQNVKIVTQDGRVTLRGPVKSAAEKDQVEKIATEVAGAEKVDSQLEVERNP